MLALLGLQTHVFFLNSGASCAKQVVGLILFGTTWVILLPGLILVCNSTGWVMK